MGRACTVCTHPEANSIDAALGAGQTLRALAAQYGLSDSALDRHARRHLWPEFETDVGAEAAHDNRRIQNSTPAHVEAPKEKRSILARVPAPVWAFVGGYMLCLLRRNVGPAETDAGEF